MNKDKKNKKTVHLSYPVGDFLIRVKNIAMAGKKEVRVPATNIINAVALVLKEEGYLSEVNKVDNEIVAKVAYQKKEPVVLNIKLISRPGLRRYMDLNEIESYRGPATFIVSTSKGVISSRKAIKQRVGGEVIAKVW